MVRDLPAVGETWARALGWGECHGQRSRGALCAGVSVAVMVDLGDGVLSILSSGLHTAPSVQAPALLRESQSPSLLPMPVAFTALPFPGFEFSS